MDMTEGNHVTPCDNLSNFKKLMIGLMGLQSVFVIASLSITLNSMVRLSAFSEKQIQMSERQRVIEKKADEAQTASNRALAISGKSEADIAWIREGFTELKMLVRDAVNNNPRTLK